MFLEKQLNFVVSLFNISHCTKSNFIINKYTLHKPKFPTITFQLCFKAMCMIVFNKGWLGQLGLNIFWESRHTFFFKKKKRNVNLIFELLNTKSCLLLSQTKYNPWQKKSWRKWSITLEVCGIFLAFSYIRLYLANIIRCSKLSMQFRY